MTVGLALTCAAGAFSVLVGFVASAVASRIRGDSKRAVTVNRRRQITIAIAHPLILAAVGWMGGQSMRMVANSARAGDAAAAVMWAFAAAASFSVVVVTVWVMLRRPR